MNLTTALALLDASLDKRPDAVGQMAEGLDALVAADDQLGATESLIDGLTDLDILTVEDITTADIERLADLVTQVAVLIRDARTNLQDSRNALERVDAYFEDADQ